MLCKKQWNTGFERQCKVAIEWQPEGKRKVGQPKFTWRRMVENPSKRGGPAGSKSGV